LGGRGRLADVKDAGELAWPARPATFPGGRLLLYLVTPALWPDGWRPPLPQGVTLVAAATGEAQPVATSTPGRSWRADRRLRWAVPAGSVYLLQFPDQDAAAAFAASTHGAAHVQAEQRLRTAGFGVVLTGVWE
jgi:CRISPR-associated protein Cmr3